MNFEDHFSIADDYITHVDSMMDSLNNQFLENQYLGFVIVSTVTVFEIAAKDIIFEFAKRKHKVFGEFMAGRFEKFNARIQVDDMKRDFVSKFGEKYVKRFDRELAKVERQGLVEAGQSTKGAYKNLINWRHNFVHTGSAPQTTNYQEVKKFYDLGKDVVRCLDKSLYR